MIEQNGIEIDEKKVNNLLTWLIRMEAENVKTDARDDVKIRGDIEKKIKEVVECY
ncbi:MAG: hypothetical protein LBM93_04205 [Oscillospiraceae bacterium]|jgi:uncharacterized protein YijF (DUF1287 family)|nr:hypothetical protein [Oscillospiraceae bacterium]